MKSTRLSHALLTLALFVMLLTPVPGCGSSSSPAPISISITARTFSPQNLEVPAGATVVVQNNDSEGHSVTSQATAGAFSPGSVNGISFDTGVFMGKSSITIPDTAQVGTVIPYFCTNHLSMMANQPTITVIAAGTGPGY
jgi:plastocyanin